MNNQVTTNKLKQANKYFKGKGVLMYYRHMEESGNTDVNFLNIKKFGLDPLSESVLKSGYQPILGYGDIKDDNWNFKNLVNLMPKGFYVAVSSFSDFNFIWNIRQLALKDAIIMLYDTNSCSLKLTIRAKDLLKKFNIDLHSDEYDFSDMQLHVVVS